MALKDRSAQHDSARTEQCSALRQADDSSLIRSQQFPIDGLTRLHCTFVMISKSIRRCWLAVGLLLGSAAVSVADVTLHGLFSDNMILQRDASVPIWGCAEDGEKITVQFRSQKVTTTAKGGQWMARLKPLKAGGPDELTVSGKNSVTLKNVLVG